MVKTKDILIVSEVYQHILSLFHIPLPEYPTVLNVIPVPLLMLCEPMPDSQNNYRRGKLYCIDRSLVV